MNINTDINNQTNNLSIARSLADGHQSCTLHGDQSANLTAQLIEQLPAAPEPLRAAFESANPTEQSMLNFVQGAPEIS